MDDLWIAAETEQIQSVDTFLNVSLLRLCHALSSGRRRGQSYDQQLIIKNAAGTLRVDIVSEAHVPRHCRRTERAATVCRVCPVRSRSGRTQSDSAEHHRSELCPSQHALLSVCGLHWQHEAFHTSAAEQRWTNTLRLPLWDLHPLWYSHSDQHNHPPQTEVSMTCSDCQVSTTSEI